MLEKSRTFAVREHGDQRYGDLPYSYHLDAVVGLLEPYGERAQVIGYLHDVVEDTNVSVAEIEVEFDAFVAAVVDILSDEPGVNRKERKARTYHKMSHVGCDLEIALLVKVADRLANVLAAREFKRRDKLKMYQDEQSAFRNAVYRRGLCDALWEQLDTLLTTD